MKYLDITAVPVNSDIPEICAWGTKIYYQLRFFSTCIDFPGGACEFLFICDLCFTKLQRKLARLGELGGLAYVGECAVKTEE